MGIGDLAQGSLNRRRIVIGGFCKYTHKKSGHKM